MSPEIEHDQFVKYSDDELYLMRDNGVCVTCDFWNTCRNPKELSNLKDRSAIKHIKFVVKYCSAHTVQGHRDFGIRGH